MPKVKPDPRALYTLKVVDLRLKESIRIRITSTRYDRDLIHTLYEKEVSYFLSFRPRVRLYFLCHFILLYLSTSLPRAEVIVSSSSRTESFPVTISEEDP